MAKRLTALGVVAAAMTSAIVIATLVPASSQQATTKKFRLCETNNSGFSKDIDVGDHGFSAGDYSVASSPAYKHGHRVATDVSKVTIVHRLAPHDARVIIDATMILGAGKLTAYGPARASQFERGVRFAVTGGTGLYRQADGTVGVKNGRCLGKGGIHLTFRLSLK